MPEQFLCPLGSVNKKEKDRRRGQIPHRILCIPLLYLSFFVSYYFFIFFVSSFPTSGTEVAIWILFKLLLTFNFMFATFPVNVDCFVFCFHFCGSLNRSLYFISALQRLYIKSESVIQKINKS